MLKGDFFKSSKNSLYCPSQKAGLEWGEQRDKDGKPYTTSEFFVPADYEKNLLGAYNKYFTNLYYLTPGSIFKTFFYNGEGFAYQAFLQQQSIIKYLGGATIAGFSAADLKKFGIDKGVQRFFIEGSRCDWK